MAAAAVGFALNVERVHIALTGEERGCAGRRHERAADRRPRGALFADTLDLLDRLGIDTREVRENDRKLLFEDSGIITMRPSDVPPTSRPAPPTSGSPARTC